MQERQGVQHPWRLAINGSPFMSCTESTPLVQYVFQTWKVLSSQDEVVSELIKLRKTRVSMNDGEGKVVLALIYHKDY